MGSKTKFPLPPEITRRGPLAGMARQHRSKHLSGPDSTSIVITESFEKCPGAIARASERMSDSERALGRDSAAASVQRDCARHLLAGPWQFLRR